MRHVVRQRRPAKQELDRVADRDVALSAPWNVGVVTSVMLSVCDAPESEATEQIRRAAGRRRGVERDRQAPVVEVLPAASVRVRRNRFGPSAPRSPAVTVS